MKILITRPWPEPAMAKVLSAFPDAEVRQSNQGMDRDEMAAALAAYDMVAPTLGDCLDAQLFETVGANPRCKLLANFGVGVDHIDLSAAKDHGIAVSNTPGAVTDATAEVAMMLMLMCARRAGEAQAMLTTPPGWPGWNPTQLLGQGLKGKTLGIIGMGGIGKEVARRAYLGFGMEVLFYNRTPRPGIMGLVATQVDTVDSLCQRADVVSVHAAASAQTRHIVGADQARAIGPTGILINTARGELIDELAVMQALDQGWLGAAGIDVFQNEPHLNPRWFQTPNAVLLPHLGTATIEARTAMALKSLANMKAFASDGPLVDPVT